MLMAPCTLVFVVCTGIVLVVDRRGRAGEIVDLVDLDDRAGTSRRGASARSAGGRADARCCARVPVKKLSTQMTSCTFGKQPLAKVRAEKTGAAGDQDAASAKALLLAPPFALPVIIMSYRGIERHAQRRWNFGHAVLMAHRLRSVGLRSRPSAWQT